MSTVNELTSTHNQISSDQDELERLYIKKRYDKLPKIFEAIVLSGIPEQSNDWQGTTTVSEATIAEKNNSRYYFVRVRPLGVQEMIIPDPFLAADLPTAKRLINSHPLGYIEVHETVHPPTHGDIFECRYTTKDKRGIALVKRLRRHDKKINALSNQALHTAFNPDKNPGLVKNYGGAGGGGGVGGVSNPSSVPPGEHPWRDVWIEGSVFPDGKITDKKNVKGNKWINSEYIPAMERALAGETKGLKLLATVMAIKEGFRGPPKTTRSYKHNNPGNIGNTDSGANKSLPSLEDGIRLQRDYIKKVAEGRHRAYPLGKKKTIKPYYSEEIARNQKTYRGKSPFLPGYRFVYTGQIDQYVKIYSTGARGGNSYVSLILSYFRQNGISLTPQSLIQDIIRMN